MGQIRNGKVNELTETYWCKIMYSGFEKKQSEKFIFLKRFYFLFVFFMLAAASFAVEWQVSVMQPPPWQVRDRVWNAEKAAGFKSMAVPPPIFSSAALDACGVRSLVYYVDWDYSYRSDKLPMAKLTHICHAFITPNSDGSLAYSGTYLEPALITDAHAAGVKVLTSIGTGSFATAVSTLPLRTTFINNLESFCRTYGYDGVDIDWESPTNATERTNMTSFVTELKAKFTTSASPAPSWLISMAVGGSNWSGQWYDYPNIKNNIDFLNFMAYDSYGPWSNSSGHNMPVYKGTDPSNYNCKTGMDYLINTRGISASKINMGLPFYGYRFPNSPYLYGSCGGICSSASAVNYDSIASSYIGNGWTTHWDSGSLVPYLTNNTGTGVLAYDSPLSIEGKVDYALNSRTAGGVFVWQAAGDYLSGNQPLLDSMYNAILSNCGILPTVTATPVATPVATATPEQADLDFEGGAPYFAYPNPAKNSDVKIRFTITAPAKMYNFNLYSLGYRLIGQSGWKSQNMPKGQNEITVSWNKYLSTLAQGIYIYYIEITDGSDGKAKRSKVNVIVIGK